MRIPIRATCCSVTTEKGSFFNGEGLPTSWQDLRASRRISASGFRIQGANGSLFAELVPGRRVRPITLALCPKAVRRTPGRATWPEVGASAEFGDDPCADRATLERSAAAGTAASYCTRNVTCAARAEKQNIPWTRGRRATHRMTRISRSDTYSGRST